MKKTVYHFVIVFVTGLIFTMVMASCRRDKVQLTIHQYDSVQIQNYIRANGLTGFKRDTVGGDTSGIYYKVLIPGSGTPIQYSDKLPFVYTERTFDGSFALTDTISQHFYDFVGHLQQSGYPLGIQIAVHDLLVYPDASIEVLVPSHLAFGKTGAGSGSSQVANNRIGGNQCMDWYLHAINSYSHPQNPFGPYDDLVIRNYMRDSSLTGYSETADSIYYKVLTSGSSTDSIRDYSSFSCTYTGQLLDGTIFDGSHNGTNTITFPAASLTLGTREILEKYAVAGTKISIILPSKQVYGLTPPAGSGIPVFAPLRFTWQILTVTP